MLDLTPKNYKTFIQKYLQSPVVNQDKRFNIEIILVYMIEAAEIMKRSICFLEKNL